MSDIFWGSWGNNKKDGNETSPSKIKVFDFIRPFYCVLNGWGKDWLAEVFQNGATQYTITQKTFSIVCQKLLYFSFV